MHTNQIIVTGKVQGVFYRFSCWEVATELGIKGLVQNLPDGNVLILANGEEHAVQKLIKWCKKGPARAQVETVSITKTAYQEFYDFSIIK